MKTDLQTGCSITLLEISFWDLAGLHAELPHAERIEALICSISELPLEQIVAFHRFCQEQQEKAQTDRFFIAAPYLHSDQGLCTNAHFIELTAWLVFQGKEIYAQAANNPDMLGEAACTACDLTAPKDFLHICSKAYTKKTGRTNFGEICDEFGGPMPLARMSCFARQDIYADPLKFRLVLPNLCNKYLRFNGSPEKNRKLKKADQPVEKVPIRKARIWWRTVIGTMIFQVVVIIVLYLMLAPTIPRPIPAIRDQGSGISIVPISPAIYTPLPDDSIHREVSRPITQVFIPKDDNLIDKHLFDLMEKHYGTRQVEFAQFLFQHKNRVNLARDSIGRTLLDVAAFDELRDETLLLLTAGANPNLTDASGRTPLSYAAAQNSHDGDVIADLLLLKGADVHAQGESLLNLALEDDNLRLADHLMMKGAPMGPSSAYEEALDKDPDLNSLVQSYNKPPIKYGDTVAVDGFTAAASRGDVTAIRDYLAVGYKPDRLDSSGKSALLCATTASQGEVVAELLIGGADPSEPARKSDVGPFQIMFGKVTDDSDDMRLELLAAGAETHEAGNDGNSMLGKAVRYANNDHAAQWIIWMGNDPNKATPQGTPMQQAKYRYGWEDMVALLQRNGAKEKPR